jgi:hypothetical protein
MASDRTSTTGIHRRDLLLGAGAVSAGVAAATLGRVAPASADAFFGSDAVIYPAGLFTGSQLGNKFPARSRPHLTSIAGGSAGNHSVPDIGATDDLAGVLCLNRDSTASNIDITDLTSEFTISADGTINNSGGTNTTGDTLLVSYATPPGTQLAGLPYPADEVSKGTLPLLVPAAWSSVTISILGLAGSLGEGTVRLGWGGDTPTDTVDIDVDLYYLGPLEFDPAPAWNPLSGVLADYQFTQFSLYRFGQAVEDDLAEPFCVIFVILTEGE